MYTKSLTYPRQKIFFCSNIIPRQKFSVLLLTIAAVCGIIIYYYLYCGIIYAKLYIYRSNFYPYLLCFLHSKCINMAKCTFCVYYNCAYIQSWFFYIKTVDVRQCMRYNNVDVRIRIILFIKFNIRFVVSFLLFYTYFFHFSLFSPSTSLGIFFAPI